MTNPNRAAGDQYSDIDWVARDADGSIKRRTIVQGGAWSIPVVAVAVAAPLAAASTQPTDNVLVFDENLYTPDSDCALNGVTTTLTDADGAPIAGELVTVTLPAGYTFADGSSTRTLPTDAAGQVAWPEITAQPGAGTFTMTATTDTAPATTADIVIVDETTAFEYNASTRKTVVLGSVPAGATPLGAGYFQTANGDIYKGNDPTPVITGAGAAKGYAGASAYFLEYTKDGVAHTYRTSNGAIADYAHIPGDAVPVGGGFFLRPNGELYQWNQTSGPIATGVTSASGYAGTGGTYWVDFVDASGGHSANATNGTITDFNQVGAGATAVGGGFFLGANGVLRYRNTLISNNVESAAGYPSNKEGGDYWVDYVLTNGNAWESTSAGTDYRKANIPANATPVGGGYWLAGTTLYSWAGNGTRVPGGSNVAAAVGYESILGSGGYWTDFVVNPSGCLV
ncbi:hypothetical protein SAMN06295885_3099 [Rathayibacter oskolensis]|uniref:Big-1 domain-containing protein n=1 Tax=Rathayibacter oskolensis TaxID=1891671 RepID=A0A1X7PC69_9MICO|nr:hypothetical protein [Rathayibacter oskolensis]SMH48684.1 hypothetical protein SAMN06295885_3099 [Rathayibacter oskolensis]